MSQASLRSIIVIGVLCAGAAGRAAAQDKPLILDESCYWRCYYANSPAKVSAALLKAEGEKWLGKDRFAQLRRQVEYAAQRDKRKLDDWAAEVAYVYPWRGNGSGAGVIDVYSSPPPPEAWAQADFDDAGWTRQRLPYLVSRYIGSKTWTFEDMNLGAQLACFRTSFDLGDPATAGPLTLSVAYRGGVRVLVNGREVARGHLGTGELGPLVRAEAYPAEAYYLKSDECRPIREMPNVTAPELRGRFEDLRQSGGFGNLNVWMNRAGWDRIQAARTRRLERLEVPANLLRKGVNVLAVEVRASELHPLALRWQDIWGVHNAWFHAMLERLELRGAGSPQSSLRRPAGVQVWVEDVNRRVYSPDFADPSAVGRPVRVVAARNGSFSAQVVVGTDRELAGLKVSVVDLRSADGKGLPASAIRVAYPLPHAATELTELGENRGKWQQDPFSEPSPVLIARYVDVGDIADPQARRAKTAEQLKKIQFFDHLPPSGGGAGVPGSPADKPVPLGRAIPANTCQPAWLTFTIAADAAPGEYRGRLRVEADSGGTAFQAVQAGGTTRQAVPSTHSTGWKPVPPPPLPVDLPIELSVADWRLPDPRDFQTVMALEQSPYGVALQYKVPLWSDEHFRLMEASLAQLGRVGNDWWNVPVLAFSEFGNREDSPIVWVRRADGSWAFDYKALDRYLDAVVRHCGKPMVVNFVVNHPSLPGRDVPPPLEVTVLDESTGKRELTDVGSQMPLEQRRQAWKAFATGLRAHMQQLGLGDVMYWGYGWDGVGEPSMVEMLAEFTPGIKWAKGCHGAGPDATFTAVSSIYNGLISIGRASRKGWKRPEIHLANPRHAGTTQTCFGNSEPFAWRLLADRAIAAGGRGLARLGADYWGPVYMSGYKGSVYLIGMPCNFLLYPGPGGGESCIRYEALREGIQEAEARIFLEQVAETTPSDERRQRITQLLNGNNDQTLFVSPGSPYTRLQEYATGWQERTRRLFALAAELAADSGVYTTSTALSAELPARGRGAASLRLVSFNRQERSWTLAADQPWIKPARAEGRQPAGMHDVAVELDATKLEPGSTATGTITLTDAGGSACRVAVTAKVGPVFALPCQRLAFNMAPGGSEGRMFSLLNTSGAELEWTAAASQPWLTVTPASGKLAPGKSAELTVTGKLPGEAFARVEATLTVREAGGASREIPSEGYVVPAYAAPAAKPSGEAVGLDQLKREDLVRFVQAGREIGGRNMPHFARPEKARDIRIYVGEKGREYTVAMETPVAFETVWKIEGKGFKAFSAEVGPYPGWSAKTNLSWTRNLRLYFELYVDGQIRTWSGPMGPGDAARLLAVDGLESAKEVRLVTRQATGLSSDSIRGRWGEPTFHK